VLRLLSGSSEASPESSAPRPLSAGGFVLTDTQEVDRGSVMEAKTMTPAIGQSDGLAARDARQASYLQDGSTWVDRARTKLVCSKIIRQLPQGRSLRVLDVGCGYHATFLRALQPRLAEGVGIDSGVSDDSKSQPRLRFALGSVESELPRQPANSFDVVLLISVLEHLWDAEACLRNCHRVLKSEGVLLVHVPTWPAKRVLELFAFKWGLSPKCEMDDHKMYYSKRDLWPLLIKVGFKPSCTRMSYTNFRMTLLSRATK